MSCQRVGVAQDAELHPCAGGGNVHAAQIVQEAYLAFLVGAHQADDNHVALLSLEAVDGVHRDEMLALVLVKVRRTLDG